MAVGSYHLALAEDEKRDKTEICEKKSLQLFYEPT